MAQAISKRKKAGKKSPLKKTSSRKKALAAKQPKEQSEVLGELYKDHRNIDKTLKAYEDQLELYRRGKAFNLQLMHDVMSYLVLNPDQYHHPLEDTFFSLIAIKDITLKEEIDKTSAEHNLIKEAGEAVLECLADQLISPTTMKESHIVLRSEKYITMLRAHMEREETLLFRPGSKLLTRRDWRELNDILHNHPQDPLFNEEVNENYLSLGQYLQERIEVTADKLLEQDYPQLGNVMEGIAVVTSSASDIASVIGHHSLGAWDDTVSSFQNLLDADSPKLSRWLTTPLACSLNSFDHLADSLLEISQILHRTQEKLEQEQPAAAKKTSRSKR